MADTHPAGPGGAAYVRISTGHQDDASQKDGIHEWLGRHSLKVDARNWFIDRGWSRTDADIRPEFQRLLQLAESGAIKWIVVLALDRFGTAGALELQHYLYRLKKAGCSLWSVTEPHYGNIARDDI